MLTHVLLLALTISDPTAIPPYGHTAARPYGYYKPRVEVWTSKGDNPFFRGDGARVYMRTDQDAYVTLFRVDTDGRVRVVYPRAPWEDNFVRGGQEFEVATIKPSVLLHIGKDGTCTVMVKHLEFGQGVTTSLPMLVAEELEVDPATVKVEQAPADPAYNNPLFGMQGTGGSTTVDTLCPA